MYFTLDIFRYQLGRCLVALLATCFHTGILLALIFNPQNGGDTSEILVDFQWTTWRYTPEDSILQIFTYMGFTVGFTYEHFIQSIFKGISNSMRLLSVLLSELNHMLF
jgi:hypothetical protein